MAIIKFPRFLGGGPSPDERQYEETEVIKNIGLWLAQLDTEEEQFRVLAYWMWRIKSKDSPRAEAMIENIAEESAEIIGVRTGFGRAKEIK